MKNAPEKRKIHPVAADGSSRLVTDIPEKVPIGTSEKIISHWSSKSNNIYREKQTRFDVSSIEKSSSFHELKSIFTAVFL